jgi:hypothetical protein
MILATAHGAEPQVHPDGVEHLAHLAATVLNEHVNTDGRCAACLHTSFPCDSAVLAEHNLALLP